MRRTASVTRWILLALAASAVSGSLEVSTAVFVAPPTLEELTGEWVGLLGGEVIHFLSLDDKAPSYLIVNVPGPGDGTTVIYTLEGLNTKSGRIWFSAKEQGISADPIRVEGSVDYWELDLVLPMSAGLKKRRVQLFRKRHLENKLEQIENIKATALRGAYRRE